MRKIHSNRRRRYVAAILLSLLCGSVLATEIQVSGFATLGAGRVFDGKEFLADSINVAIYDKDPSFKPDSMYGLQIDASLEGGLSLTAQFNARGADGYDPGLEWLYASYQASSKLRVQAGKQRIPIFTYSDSFEVGYSYPWIRPPSQVYNTSIINYDGISFDYTEVFGAFEISGRFYAGTEDSTIKIDGIGDVHLELEDILGINIVFDYQALQLRLTRLEAKQSLERDIPGAGVVPLTPEDTGIVFSGIGVIYETPQIFFASELTKFELDIDAQLEIDSWYASLGYYVSEELLPYVMYAVKEDSAAAGSLNKEESVITAGVRYNFHPYAALKLQTDRYNDESGDGAADADLISIALDIVF